MASPIARLESAESCSLMVLHGRLTGIEGPPPMKPSNLLLALAIGAPLIAPMSAAARSPSLSPQTLGRLDDLGRFAGDAPFCEVLGYTGTDPDGQAFAREIAKLTERVGADRQEVEAAISAARVRETNDLQVARDRALANPKDPSGDRTLREFADTLAVRCSRAVNDPAATVLMKPPPGAISTVSRRFVDRQLAPYGRAGWQTPYVLAGGDLAETVGTCEARTGRARAWSYLTNLRAPDAFPPDINDTIQAWLDTRIAQGRESAKKTPPSAAQCGQLFTKRERALEKAPY